MKSINERIENLPRKVALPFKKLAEIGQIEEPQLEAILDAAELTGNTQHLLGFAVGAMAMEAKFVHVCDTVRMAKLLGRKIRLDWSPRRWRDEHERLRRLVTLKEISAENCDYDVSYFRQRLPKKFPGYLIASRLKLAKVGLVQSHCVASYHQDILKQRCAFVCVFVDRVRWTVQLAKTYDGMRIVDIRTNRNGSPLPYVRNSIYRILNMPFGETSGPRAPYYPELVEEANLARALQALTSKGVQCVEMTYMVADEPQLPGIDAHLYTPVRPECLEIEGYCPQAAEDNRLVLAPQNIESLLEYQLQKQVARHRGRYYHMGANNSGAFEYGELRLDASSGELEFTWRERLGKRRKQTEDISRWDISSYKPQIAV